MISHLGPGALIVVLLLLLVLGVSVKGGYGA